MVSASILVSIMAAQRAGDLDESQKGDVVSEKRTEAPGAGASTQADLGKAGTAVKEGVIRSLKGLNEIEADIVSLVRNTVADSLKLTADVANLSLGLTTEIIKGAIKATEEVGTGLILSTKSVTKGVIMGVGDVGGDVVAVASQTVKGAVKGASEVGADVSLVARRAVDGALEAGKEMGANMEDIATARGGRGRRGSGLHRYHRAESGAGDACGRHGRGEGCRGGCLTCQERERAAIRNRGEAAARCAHARAR